MLRVPYRTQLADGYCLPACVEMVLAYWGLKVSQEKIARQLKTIPGVGTPGSRLHLLASRKLNVEYRSGGLTELQVALTQGFPRSYCSTPVSFQIGTARRPTRSSL